MIDYVRLSDGDLQRVYSGARDEIRRRSGHGKAEVFESIKSQEAAKRAAVIALVGNHSILFFGHTQVGKTMIRSAMRGFGHYDTYEAWPCKCGFKNSPLHQCTCSSKDVQDVLDAWPRCDIVVEMPGVPQRELSTRLKGTSTEEVELQFMEARKFQTEHAETISSFTRTTEKLFEQFCVELGITAGDRESIVKVATSIAALDESNGIREHHITEAVNYRPYYPNLRGG